MVSWCYSPIWLLLSIARVSAVAWPRLLQHDVRSSSDPPLGVVQAHILRDGQRILSANPFTAPQTGNPADETPGDVSNATITAMEVMQSHFFKLWLGVWPTAIDWTAAVMGTHMSAALSTISAAVKSTARPEPTCSTKEERERENLINKYFSQLVGFYFGQDTFSLRQEAYDDMLWVVLGWLESIKFILLRSSLHYSANSSGDGGRLGAGPWHGAQFVSPFAHRVRVFYDLASKGWNTTLCGGGMIWSPYLRPYKNAITNQLFITASVAMYLYFPGDDITSPFTQAIDPPPGQVHDPRYLTAALNAYNWLVASNMTNADGLFVDGYHIRGDGKGSGPDRNTNCDQRNEMVYTYNQGVLLSGLRGLWESTGVPTFLEDGHALIGSVITATGWGNQSSGSPGTSTWAGLGRGGILEEFCDVSGSCSQDGQTFKGIFFHHLASFCSPLTPFFPGPEFAASLVLTRRHAHRCATYGLWVKHNAYAAYMTRDMEGRFGMWWGHRYRGSSNGSEVKVDLPLGAVDYRNSRLAHEHSQHSDLRHPREKNAGCGHQTYSQAAEDVNDRGRGRTLETQSGGLAALRAMWEFTRESTMFDQRV